MIAAVRAETGERELLGLTALDVCLAGKIGSAYTHYAYTLRITLRLLLLPLLGYSAQMLHISLDRRRINIAGLYTICRRRYATVRAIFGAHTWRDRACRRGACSRVDR